MENEYKDWLNVKLLQKAAVTDEEGNILILTRSPESFSRPNMPDLVGGSFNAEDLETKENPHLAGIKREIEGVKIVYASSGVKQTQTAGEILVFAAGYKATVKGVKPKVTLSNEHSVYRWVSKEEALVLDFNPDGGLHHAIVEAL